MHKIKMSIKKRSEWINKAMIIVHVQETLRVQICKLEQRVCGDEFPGAPSRPYNPYPAPRPPPNLENKDKDQHKDKSTKIEDNRSKGRDPLKKNVFFRALPE